MPFYNGSNEEVFATENATEVTNFSSPEQITISPMCTRGFYWPIHSPLIAFLLLILAANGIEIVLMAWKETLRTVSNMFLVSLAVSDFLFGLVGIPLYIICSLEISFKACVSSVLVVRFTAISSVFHLLVIACDRYAIIVHSMTYHQRLTKPRATVLITFIWSLAFLSSFIQLSWYNVSSNSLTITEGKVQFDRVYLLFVLVVFLLMPLLSMLLAYSHILLISLRHIFAVRRRQRNLDQRLAPIVHDLRGTFILATMMLIFIGCWLPFFLQMLQDHIPEKFFVINQNWGFCVIIYLRFIPPLTNPLLCAFCKRDFRRAWSSLIRQPWWPSPANLYSLPSFSGARDRTTSTVNDATCSERPNSI
ncbi:histamine H2 receptor-like [Porites lutea]|uniref:histamine H2 receptor-like n=1 Tax=Porites lutea TaxID=51062 RepID=UPI003CC6539C